MENQNAKMGEKEMETGSVSVRKSREGDQGVQSIEEFVEFFKKEAEVPKAP